MRVLAEKPVARVDALDAVFNRNIDDRFNVEVGGDRAFAFADQEGLVTFISVLREPVFMRIDPDGLHA